MYIFPDNRNKILQCQVKMDFIYLMSEVFQDVSVFLKTCQAYKEYRKD